MIRFVRAFSRAPSVQRQLEKDEIAKAINLLSSRSFDSVTSDEKAKYINYFTRALNSDIKPTKVSNVSANHFSQSLLGLNSILKVSPASGTSDTLDPVSTKDLISRCETEEQVLEIFETLLIAQDLSTSNFKLVLMNKHVKDMTYLNSRLDFMKLDDLKILVCSRALMLKDFKLAKEIFSENIDQWLTLRDGDHLPKLLEKSLYQLIWKINRDINSLKSLTYTQRSYILLLESIPRQYHSLASLSLNYTLTNNQQLFMEFLSLLVSQPVSATSNKYIQQLIRLNVQNSISSETDNEMTIQKYRYINGLLELAEDMGKSYDGELVNKLVMKVHETDDVVLNETVLRFI